MRRRELIAFAAAAWLAWPRFARAQQQAKLARVGVLGFGVTPNAGIPEKCDAREPGYSFLQQLQALAGDLEVEMVMGAKFGIGDDHLMTERLQAAGHPLA